MIDHMRSEEAPAFINMSPDSAAAPAGSGAAVPGKSAPQTTRSPEPARRRSPAGGRAELQA